jgi:hypothetical protein
MSGTLKKFFDLFPSYDLPKEKEDKLVEETAQKICKMELDLPALLIGHVLVPLGPVLSQTVLVPVTPFLELLGLHGYDYLALIHNRDAVQRLIDRVEEIRTEKGRS